jgi:hypothetical protein
MMGFKNPFRKKPQRDDAALARLRGWIITELGDPAPTLTISEIECGDPACPGLETIILVMREGAATQAIRIRKPITEIDVADVKEALANLD